MLDVAKPREINLPGFFFQSEICTFVSNFLINPTTQNCHIRKLNLSDNEIGDKGVRILAENLLPHTKSLVALELRNNSITHVGAQWLFLCLESNESVIELDLGTGTRIESHPHRNKIGEGGARALARTLSKQRFLSWINLSYNMIGDKGFYHIMLQLAKTVLRLKGEGLQPMFFDFRNNLITENAME